ncbi:PH domain-containing protein [Paenibacillus agricola]|uniref:YvbH-like protein n=1 Tax=Paenibacillus agricola TaxID=2716264 RepID=A0ABX0JH74_9BACL|nr:PH domain-containing protein [Paenibacillus agricola]NHN34591.1 hypothetical protein [Paenibacillus agricola]
MFKKFAADALGLSDIGTVIKPADYDKVDADDYVMNEDNEKIFFLIKSKADEYCFTNLGLIHLDGTSAMSKKRTLRRFNYSAHTISDVMLETAGTVDMDVEIKFTIGIVSYSIDVHKKHILEVKDLYKSLLKIAEISYENDITLQYAKESVHLASNTLNRTVSEKGNIVDHFKELTESSFHWMMETRKQYKIKDFGYVFERYINM